MSKTLKVLAFALVTLLALGIFAGCKPQESTGNSSVSTQSEITDSNKNDGGDENVSEIAGGENDGTGDTSSQTSGSGDKVNNKKLVVNKTGWPITNKKVTFEIMGRASANAVDPGKMDMFTYMEKNTNVAIKYIPINENNIRERKTLALQSGDIPAAFTFAHNTFTDFELDKYSREGAFVDLSKYIKDYAPTIYADMEKNPVQKALNYMSDGKLYTLPSKTNRSDYTNYDHFLVINKSWLGALGLDIPKTMTEFLDTMREFRDGDPNGNNEKDEIPFGQWNWGANMILQSWGCHIGAGNLGIDNNYKVYFPLTSANAKAACQFWYDFVQEDGLMDTSVTGMNASGSWTEWQTHIRTGNVGCFQWSYLSPDRFPIDLLEDFVAMPVPTANFSNSSLKLPKAVNPYNSIPTRGKIIFTKACSSVPALLRYFDYLYTDDGIMVGNYGDPSNGLYTKLKNGNYKLSAKGEESFAGLKHAPGWLMGLPEATAMIDIKIEDSVKAETKRHTDWVNKTKAMYKKANQDNPALRMPSLMLTSEEIVKLRKFSDDFPSSDTAGLMSFYVDSKKNDLENWVSNVNALEAKGLSGYVALYQNVVNRNKEHIKPWA